MVVDLNQRIIKVVGLMENIAEVCRGILARSNSNSC